MKQYTSQQLQAKAEQHFENFPNDTKAFATSDGNFFRDSNRAYLHANQKNLTVFPFDKVATEVEAGSPVEPSLLDGNVPTVVNAIPFMTKQAAQDYLIAEQADKKRKTIIKVLTDYIAGLPTSVNITAPGSTELEVEETLQLEAVVLPEETQNKEVFWTSSDETKATVSETGLVTAIAAGAVVITATTKAGNLTDTQNLTVTAE